MQNFATLSPARTVQAAGPGVGAKKSPRVAGMEEDMVVLPKGTLIKLRGLPFRLQEDTPVDGLQENYNLAMSQSEAAGGSRHAELDVTSETKSMSSESSATTK
ncbi:hypothetical protein [Massilia oculi]|uniref:hypothetical protein n=1 Tax=Massilia oculi TaxID=945844 RepID=UPI001AB0039E|nr:hypothetical protein [Massilia oculi]